MLITTPMNGTADAVNLKDIPFQAKIVVLVNKMCVQTIVFGETQGS